MKSLIAVVVISALAALVRAEESTPVLYVPLVLRYVDGAFVSAGQVGDTRSDKEDCFTFLQKVIGSVQRSGSLPSGSSLVGACMPVPAKDPSPPSGT